MQNSVFSLEQKNFEEIAIQVFNFQYLHNPTYKNYCDLLNCNPKKVEKLIDIPFLPISFFKTHEVKTEQFEPEIVFSSSGTTGLTTSKHFVKSLEMYEKSFLQHFKSIYGSIDDYCVLALLPSYLERTGSSLIYMVNAFIQKSKSEESGFFLNELDQLKTVLERQNEKKLKTLLIGVSFALLDFVDQFQLAENDNLIVMETGGMKGRKKEIVREELHRQLKGGFGVKAIHSEYGMTELLSQAYAPKNGRFFTPNWMKVLIRKHDNPFDYAIPNEIGGINVIDLANLYSSAFIQTDDLGKLHNDGSFEVLGRFDAAEIRGCNLLI